MKTILNENRLDLAKLFTGMGVEIGVASGWYSSKIMELGQVEEMYGVDPYTPHQGYRDYTRETTFNKLKASAHEFLGRYPNYYFVQDYSVKAAEKFDNNSLDFVYIDGDHSYKAVMQDIKTWIKKVKPGGILAGDDYIKSARDKRFYDVIRAVDEYTTENNIDLIIYGGGRNPSNWMFYR